MYYIILIVKNESLYNYNKTIKNFNHKIIITSKIHKYFYITNNILIDNNYFNNHNKHIYYIRNNNFNNQIYFSKNYMYNKYIEYYIYNNYVLIYSKQKGLNKKYIKKKYYHPKSDICQIYIKYSFFINYKIFNIRTKTMYYYNLYLYKLYISKLNMNNFLINI